MPAVAKPLPEVMTVPQVADYLQCSEWTVRNLYNAGRLKGARVGRLVRFRRQTVDQWLAQREH